MEDVTKMLSNPDTSSEYCQVCDKCKATKFPGMLNHRGYDENIKGETSRDHDEIFLQQSQQQHEKEQKLEGNGHSFNIAESAKNEKVILIFQRSFKGANAEHEVTYRIKLSKELIK